MLYTPNQSPFHFPLWFCFFSLSAVMEPYSLLRRRSKKVSLSLLHRKLVPCRGQHGTIGTSQWNLGALWPRCDKWQPWLLPSQTLDLCPFAACELRRLSCRLWEEVTSVWCYRLRAQTARCVIYNLRAAHSKIHQSKFNFSVFITFSSINITWRKIIKI